MEFFEERIILKLKSRFFDSISLDDAFQLDFFLKEMLRIIQQETNAKELTLYTYNEFQNLLVVEVTTSTEDKMNIEIIKNKNEELEETILHSLIETDSDLLIPFQQDHQTCYYLLLKREGPFVSPHLSKEFLIHLSKECGLFLQRAQQLVTLYLEEKRYKQLFRVTEKIHSTMNMESVLEEIIDTLQKIYPSCYTYILHLSQDYEEYNGLPIREFDYDSKDESLAQSYVTGIVEVIDRKADHQSVLYAPLKGKQGVYGVLQVNAPNTFVFRDKEIEFISLLAKAAGGAVENVQLYEQSKKLITDLQLINETSHHLNSNLRLYETMRYMSDQIIMSLGAEEVGFIQFNEKNHETSIQEGSTSFFRRDEASHYIKYLISKMRKEQDSIFIGDLKLPHYASDSILYKSAMGVPMMQENILNEFVLVLHRDPYAFSFDAFKLLKSLIHHSILAVTNTILREELQKMVITDHLTKLYSRNFLDEKIQESMEKDANGTFIIIDIDNFKVVNDTFGHQIGDEVIIQVADIIQSNIRGSDIGARWGGEELAIYLPRVGLETGVQIAERLVRKVREGSDPPVTISCGVSYWKKEDHDTYNALFKRADLALYHAKKTGKNKVIVQTN